MFLITRAKNITLREKLWTLFLLLFIYFVVFIYQSDRIVEISIKHVHKKAREKDEDNLPLSIISPRIHIKRASSYRHRNISCMSFVRWEPDNWTLRYLKSQKTISSIRKCRTSIRKFTTGNNLLIYHVSFLLSFFLSFFLPFFETCMIIIGCSLHHRNPSGGITSKLNTLTVRPRLHENVHNIKRASNQLFSGLFIYLFVCDYLPKIASSVLQNWYQWGSCLSVKHLQGALWN